jgi:hypothetical protein
MVYAIAALIGFHGAVHGLGFVSSWRLGTGVPLMAPTLLTGFDPEGLVLRAAGLLWLAPVVGFGLAAIGLVLDLPVMPLLAVDASLSLILCITWWEDAKVGAMVDAVILVGVALVWLASIAA